MTDDNTISILGLGPMGRALATAALAAGHPTVVWNRTPDRAAPLVERGAVLAPTAADALGRAPVTVCCLLDHDAVRAALADVPDGSDGTLVNLSSGHAGAARETRAWADRRGLRYLDGAILTPAPTIGTPAATILYSGPRATFERHRPALAAFGGTALHLGEEIGTAAAYEMALLDLFTMSVGGLTHAFALAAAEGIPPASFARFAAGIGTLLTDMTGRVAGQLAADDFSSPVNTIASAGSAIAHVRAAAAAHGLDDEPLGAVGRIVDRAVAAGHGADGYARLARFLADTRSVPAST
ncbi:NAD(P)-dependent oxidoreductase [Micromonospora zhanjiangensis]|uniref:NAD(P)-dependent oxidoreductase n=1 Tax=Micromonospora zhanjiangensis TaxID=1522057 RepID=A0ABV8KTA6_9ACTN